MYLLLRGRAAAGRGLPALHKCHGRRAASPLAAVTCHGMNGHQYVHMVWHNDIFVNGYSWVYGVGMFDTVRNDFSKGSQGNVRRAEDCPPYDAA